MIPYVAYVAYLHVLIYYKYIFLRYIYIRKSGAFSLQNRTWN